MMKGSALYNHLEYHPSHEFDDSKKVVYSFRNTRESSRLIDHIKDIDHLAEAWE